MVRASDAGSRERGFLFFQAEDGIRDFHVTGVQTCCSSDLPGRDLGMDDVHLPAVPGDPYARLVARCAAGLTRRGLGTSWRAAARLEAELGVIARKGLASYFLTVADAAALIRSRGIRCAIRGSGAG